MIGTLGQFVREIRDLLTGSGDPIPVDIGTSIDVSIDNTNLEISNDSGNPIPVVSGLSIPRHDYVELTYTGADVTGVAYKVGGSWNTGTDTYTGGTTVGQLELVYSSGNLVKVVEV
jgi:hypothetical protein